MKENDWKKRLGVVFSTDPDFVYTEEASAEAETLPKTVTLVSGFVGSEEDLKALGKELKVRLGVGGSAKDGEITVQGDFRDKVTALLQEWGYTRAKRGN